MDQFNRPKTWDATRRGKAMPFIYNTIKEIQDETRHWQNGGKKAFYLFGAVKDFRSPSKSRGSDYYCLFRIIDESCCDDGIKVTLFGDEGRLPHINELDIIRLHRMKPFYKDGGMTLISTWGWSIVQWDTQDKEVGNGKSILKTYPVDQYHKHRVKQLKDWVKSLFFNNNNSSLLCESEYKLENITREYYFSMTCQIAGIVKLRDALTVLRVWDGTTPALKIPFIPDIEKDGLVEMDGMSLLKNLMVDVCVYDGHSRYIAENNITLGSYISFTNLHCTRKKDDKEGFELILHGGHLLRGIKLLDDADPNLDEMKKKTADLLMQAKTNQNQLNNTNIQSTSSSTKKRPSSDSESSFKSPPPTMMTSLGKDQPPPKKYLLDTSPLPLNFTVEKVNLLHKESNTVAILELLDPEKLSQDEFLQETSLNDEDVVVVGSQSQEQDLRCQLKPSTVVFRDPPDQITSLVEVISTFISTTKPILFRVRVNIDKFSNPNDSIIYYCPPSNLRIPAKNTGENIELANDVANFLHLWRSFRGLEDENSECDVINDDENVNQEHTQWMLPNSVMNVMKTEYTSPKDDSLWQKLEVDNEYVIHQLKQGSQRFYILYTKDINGKEDFKKHAQKYDRVVHILSREKLTSNSLPPVCYQDGVFYYWSPACVGEVRIPTLAQEAETFHFKQPLQALTIPLLLIKFTFRINISDQSGVLNDLLLQGKNAVDFFNGTTPSQYLLNYEDCANDVQKDICNLTNAENVSNLELIIEKKARKSPEDGKDDVFVYDVINTRLKRN